MTEGKLQHVIHGQAVPECRGCRAVVVLEAARVLDVAVAAVFDEDPVSAADVVVQARTELIVAEGLAWSDGVVIQWSWWFG